jgi:hypothetical protein
MHKGKKKKSVYGTMGPHSEKDYAGIPFKNAAIKRMMQNRKVGTPGAAGTTFVTKKPKTTA